VSELLTPKEAAAYLRVSVSVLFDHCRDGLLAWIRIGGSDDRPRRRFERADLDAFIESRRTKQPAGPALPPGGKPRTKVRVFDIKEARSLRKARSLGPKAMAL
jgi:excisionase family DNA binding protein